MSELSKKIFHEAPHRVSSPFGKRTPMKTAAGVTSSFHSGCDYSTYGIKAAQYAIADGEIISCGIDSDYGNAKFVWVKYPALGVKMLHYHLDNICVKSGQKVSEKTVLGHTGRTGRATGIHLHLGVKRLSGGGYIDPEAWSKNEYKQPSTAAKPAYKPGNYEVTAEVLNVRIQPTVKADIVPFAKLSADAKAKILKLTGKKVSGYVKGLKFSAGEVKAAGGYHWGKTPSGWVALEFCKKI